MAQTDKVRVYGKAQNRTALGIIHAWALAYPNGTLEDLRAAFPNSLNPDKGTKENFILSHEKGTEANWDGYFKEPEEIVLLQDGSQVSVVKMWTKPSFERIVAKAKEYGIVVAEFTEAEKGFGKKGGFRLEYLNGWTPPVVKKKCKLCWLWLLLALLAIAAAVYFFCFYGK